jgi:hypothetical protein
MKTDDLAFNVKYKLPLLCQRDVNDGISKWCMDSIVSAIHTPIVIQINYPITIIRQLNGS